MLISFTLTFYLGGRPTHFKKTRSGINRKQKWFKTVAVPTLLYGSETGIATQRNLNTIQSTDEISKKCSRL